MVEVKPQKATKIRHKKVIEFDEIDWNLDDYQRVRVTPQVAAIFLALNVENNREGKRRAEQYQRDMINGRWVEQDGNNIKFNTNGRMFDGANRCRAIVASGVTLNLDIKTCCPINAMETVDDIAVRTNGDAIKIKLNMPNAVGIASVSSVVQLLHNGAYNMGTHVGVNVKPTRQEIVAFAALNEQRLQDAYRMGARLNAKMKVKGMGPRHWFVCDWLTRMRDAKKAEEWLNSIENEGTTGIAGVFVEEALMKDPETGRQRPAEWVCQKYIREFDRTMVGSRREMGGTPEKMAAAYKAIWREYCDQLKNPTIHTGFTWLEN